MPCNNCINYRPGRNRDGSKRRPGSGGWCALRDQEYGEYHECSDYAPSSYRNSSAKDNFAQFSDEPSAAKKLAKGAAAAAMYDTSTSSSQSTFNTKPKSGGCLKFIVIPIIILVLIINVYSSITEEPINLSTLQNETQPLLFAGWDDVDKLTGKWDNTYYKGNLINYTPKAGTILSVLSNTDFQKVLEIQVDFSDVYPNISPEKAADIAIELVDVEMICNYFSFSKAIIIPQDDGTQRYEVFYDRKTGDHPTILNGIHNFSMYIIPTTGSYKVILGNDSYSYQHKNDKNTHTYKPWNFGSLRLLDKT